MRDLSPAGGTWDDWVHRSSKAYAYAAFACEDSACSSWYADGSGANESAVNTTHGNSTDPEMWELSGVSGESDVTSVVVDDANANAPHAFFYPTDWGTGYSDRLALYYSVPGEDGEDTAIPGDPSYVYYTIHDDTGWPSDPINDPSYWATATLVAQGPADTPGVADHLADHPWAMLTRDGSDRRVQLFLQSQHNDNQTVVQIESVDEGGDDFGLGCSSDPCDYTIIANSLGSVAIDADGTSATSYVHDARHSRVGWSYIEDPYIDKGTDSPFMIFQLQRPGAGSCADSGYDDIGKATGDWDTGDGRWEWTVETDGGSPDCPVVHIEDGHDNTLIPLPGGEYKLYYKEYGTDTFYVTYWDGSTWGDDAAIEFVWDGSTTSGPDNECISNISALVHKNGAVIHEGMFFLLLDSDLCDATGLHHSSSGYDSAIVFAEHVN